MSNNIGKTIHGITITPRKIIRPKTKVDAATPAQKQEVQKAAQQVMSTRRKVLEALGVR